MLILATVPIAHAGGEGMQGGAFRYKVICSILYDK